MSKSKRSTPNQRTLRARHSIKFTEPSRTKQEFKSECNINTIMSRYEKSGMITHINNHQAQYGDFTEIGDYQDALNLVIRAEDLFFGLPAQLRKRFGNDPQQFLEFAENPENHDEMVELGLLDNPKIEKPSQTASKAADETRDVSVTEVSKDKESATSKSQVKDEK